MAKRDYYEILGVSKTASACFVRGTHGVLPLTKAGVFATIDLQHPVLASASAGLFDGAHT